MPIIVPRRRGAFAQPTGLHQLDLSHPLAKSIAFSAIPSAGKRAVSHVTVPLLEDRSAGATTVGATQKGLAYDLAPTSAVYGLYAPLAQFPLIPLGASDALTLEFIHISSGYVSLAHLFGIGAQQNSGNGKLDVNVGDPTYGGDGSLRGVLTFNNHYYWWGAAHDFDTGVAWDTDSVPHHCFFTFDGSGGAVNFYRDGVLAASGTASGTIAVPSANHVVIGSCHPAVAASSPTKIVLARIHRGALSGGQVAALTANPWQVYRQSPSRFWMLPAAAGGTTTITPSAGSITTSGLAPQLAAKVATGLGSISTTGYAPSAIRVSVITPGVGAIAVSGLAPTASQIIGRVPGVGAITVSGLAPTVTQQIGRVPGVGAIAVTGYAPSTGGAIAITPGVGSITVTGLAPQLASTVVPGVGAITTTGYTPVLNGALTIQPGVGSISVSGLASSLISLVGVQAGAIAFQGYQPGVTRGFVVVPGVGSITVTGLAGTLRATVVPGVGAITVQGQSAAQQGTTTITPGVGAISVSGIAPTRAIVTFITPNVGSASVAGYAPVVAWTDNHTIAVPAGAITFTGYAATSDAAGALDAPRFRQRIRVAAKRINGKPYPGTGRIGGPIQ